MGHGGVLLHDVVPQLVRPGEAFRAFGARERPLARVRPVMPLQVRQPEERQVAVGALVRFEAGMRLHVPPEVLLVEERPLARRALHRTAGHAVLGLGFDVRLEVHLGPLVLGLRQYGHRSVVLVHVLVHHHLRAQYGRVIEGRVVVRRVVHVRVGRVCRSTVGLRAEKLTVNKVYRLETLRFPIVIPPPPLPLCPRHVRNFRF